MFLEYNCFQRAILDAVFTYYNEGNHQFLFLRMNNCGKIKIKLKGKGQLSKMSFTLLQNYQTSKIAYASLFKAMFQNTA